jgi:hypothetical protein
VYVKNVKSKQAICGKCGANLELHGAVTEVDEKIFGEF